MLPLLLASSVAHAVAFGPSVLVGAVITLPVSSSTLELAPGAGPLGELQFELGERFIHSFVLQYSTVGITSNAGSSSELSFRQTLTCGGYRFSFDLFGRQGKPPVSPYIGVGTLFGLGSTDLLGSTGVVATGASLTLEFDALLGLHWRLAEHFGLRGELGVSSYGGLGAVQPRVGGYASF